MKKARIIVSILLFIGAISVNAKITFTLYLRSAQKVNSYTFTQKPAAQFLKHFIENKGKDFFIEYYFSTWPRLSTDEIAIGKNGMIYYRFYNDEYNPDTLNTEEKLMHIKEMNSVLKDISKSNDTLLVELNEYKDVFAHSILTDKNLWDELPYTVSNEEYETYIHDNIMIKKGLSCEYYTSDGKPVSIEEENIGALILYHAAVRSLFWEAYIEYVNEKRSKNQSFVKLMDENAAYKKMDPTIVNELYDIVLRKIDEYISVPTRTSIILPFIYED